MKLNPKTANKFLVTSCSRTNVIYAHVITQNFESKILILSQIGFSFSLGAFEASGIENFDAYFGVAELIESFTLQYSLSLCRWRCLLLSWSFQRNHTEKTSLEVS